MNYRHKCVRIKSPHITKIMYKVNTILGAIELTHAFFRTENNMLLGFGPKKDYYMTKTAT